MNSRAVPDAVSALFPSAAERGRVDDALTRKLLEASERVCAGPVLPTIDGEDFRRALDEFDFEEPRSLDTMLDWVIARMESGVVHMNHPRYFGLFNPSPNFPSICADRIAGVFNPQLASSGSSPAPVEIEAHVIRALARRAGLPEGSAGHFATSGSEANYTALVCALTRANPDFARDGVRAFSGPVTFYTSRDCQPAWHKIAHQSGVGRAALRLVPTDGSGRLDANALARMVDEDRAGGAVPVLISPTAGTTGAGMIDPLDECADIARSCGAWLHVDAAWGGAALASTKLRALFAGIERADSITIDAHKWFATTMGCGMFLTRHAALLSETFRVTTGFMPSELNHLDPYLNTVQWSRRFLGLRLFLAMATAGWSGYAAHVEHACAVVEHARRLLTAQGWTIVNDSQLAVLCVLPPAGAPAVREIVKRVLAGADAWVAPTVFEGRDVVRICATHGESSEEDVERLVRALQAAL